VLRADRPDIHIEIRWCPAYSGVESNGEADKWTKLAAEEPDAHGVEWLDYGDRCGGRPMTLPRSLANIRREISSERKWAEPAERSTECQRNSVRTGWWLGVRSDWPGGSTS